MNMAASLNRVLLIGRLGQDPKLSYLPSGTPVAEFSVATNERFKDRDGNPKETSEFHRVKVFGRSAEFVEKYIGKGRLVYVEGSLKTRSWDDQQGQKRYITEVVVSAPGHTVQSLDKGPDRGDQPQERPPARGNQNSGRRQQSEPQPGELGGPAFPSSSSDFDSVPF